MAFKGTTGTSMIIERKPAKQNKHVRSCTNCIHYQKDWCNGFGITCSSTANAKHCTKYIKKELPKVPIKKKGVIPKEKKPKDKLPKDKNTYMYCGLCCKDIVIAHEKLRGKKMVEAFITNHVQTVHRLPDKKTYDLAVRKKEMFG